MGELFYLRTLLLHIKGCESWKDLLKYEDRIYKTFKEAVNARGLLDTIDDWVKYFEEAALVSLPHMLRELFVIVINHGEDVDISRLWELFKESMCEDFIHKGLHAHKAENMAKAGIQKQLEVNGLSLANYGIKLPNNFLLADENAWVKTEQLELGNSMRRKMTERQEKIVKDVLSKINQLQKSTLKNGCIYIDGPGGSGKTYTYKTICHLLRANYIKYKTSSWMGIAANLLPDGRTMHKTFGLPFNINKDATSHAKVNNKVGKELVEAQVFIIDEISMVPKYAIEIIDRKLKELMRNDLPFGGKIMIIDGDFRQILPVQGRAGRAQLVSLSVKHSALWKHFQVFRLKENKRALQGKSDQVNGPEQIDFAEFTLKMGNGDLKCDENESVEIPEDCIAKNDLVEEVFGEFIKDGNFFEMSKRVILTPTNEKVFSINNKILQRLEKKGHKMTTFLSVDRADSDQPKGYIEYPPEFLHSLNESGFATP